MDTDTDSNEDILDQYDCPSGGLHEFERHHTIRDYVYGILCFPCYVTGICCLSLCTIMVRDPEAQIAKCIPGVEGSIVKCSQCDMTEEEVLAKPPPVRDQPMPLRTLSAVPPAYKQQESRPPSYVTRPSATRPPSALRPATRPPAYSSNA